MPVIQPSRRRLTGKEQNQLDQLLDLSSEEYQLNDWEIDFIEHLAKKRDKPASTRELAKLNEISAKAL